MFTYEIHSCGKGNLVLLNGNTEIYMSFGADDVMDDVKLPLCEKGFIAADDISNGWFELGWDKNKTTVSFKSGHYGGGLNRLVCFQRNVTDEQFESLNVALTQMKEHLEKKQKDEEF